MKPSQEGPVLPAFAMAGVFLIGASDLYGGDDCRSCLGAVLPASSAKLGRDALA